jgi:hypothetical protein
MWYTMDGEKTQKTLDVIVPKWLYERILKLVKIGQFNKFTR